MLNVRGTNHPAHKRRQRPFDKHPLASQYRLLVDLAATNLLALPGIPGILREGDLAFLAALGPLPPAMGMPKPTGTTLGGGGGTPIGGEIPGGGIPGVNGTPIGITATGEDEDRINTFCAKATADRVTKKKRDFNIVVESLIGIVVSC